MTKSVDPDQMPQNVASDLGLHCLHRPISVQILRVIMVSKNLIGIDYARIADRSRTQV